MPDLTSERITILEADRKRLESLARNADWILAPPDATGETAWMDAEGKIHGHDEPTLTLPDPNAWVLVMRNPWRSKYEAMERRALIAEEAVLTIAEENVEFEMSHISHAPDLVKEWLDEAEARLIASGTIKPEKESSNG